MISLENSLSGLSDFYKFCEVTKLKYLVDKIVKLRNRHSWDSSSWSALPCPVYRGANPTSREMPAWSGHLIPRKAQYYTLGSDGGDLSY